MAAYSQDLRDRVLAACERGEPKTSIAKRLEVSESWVHRVCRRFKQTGQRTAQRQGGYKTARLSAWQETIQGWMAQKPDLTLEEMAARLSEQGVTVALSTLWYQLARWGMRFKKKSPGSRAASRGC